METLISTLLIIHIIAGFISLTVGFIPFVVTKGGKAHHVAGKIFYYAMLIVATSALILASYHFNPFLFIVGILTGYATLTGYRGLIRKRRGLESGTWYDKLLFALTVALFGTYMIICLPWLLEHNAGFLPVIGVFAVVLLIQLAQDLRIFFSVKTEKKGKFWIGYHIQRISGAYIAAFTAFLVTNIEIQPVFITWLLPTIVGVPFIRYFRNKYAKIGSRA